MKNKEVLAVPFKSPKVHVVIAVILYSTIRKENTDISHEHIMDSFVAASTLKVYEVIKNSETSEEFKAHINKVFHPELYEEIPQKQIEPDCQVKNSV